jgi:hypothetical protein
VGAAIAYTITVTTFPISYVQYKLDKINSSNAVTDAGQFTGSLPGASGSNSTTLSTRITSTGSSENLIYDQKYALYLRSVDGSGQIGPESLVRRFTTSNEVAPTAVAPTLTSTSVSYDTAPFISITWAAGTAGTYAIGTRKYSVVAGTAAAGADNTFTAVTGSTGTVSVTTTYAGVAILPNTQYTVYMKYAATSPGVTSATASATHTTAAEILADAPTISLASTPTTITITRGNVPTPPTPTYLYKYQYAYGTSATPTNYADFSTSGTTQTITGLLHATTFYVSIKAVSLVTGASGAISSTSIATQAEVAPTPVAPTLTSTSVSYSTAPFISITWAAGTAGTYAIATRQYSVVEGTGAAGTFTTASGTTGTVSPTTTAAGAAILPNTQYTVYMKYIATSPGSTSTTASATHTTAAEILASAPSVSLASTPTTITITRGDVPTPPIPTYLYKYQYAYGTTVDPTNFADFPSTGTASSVTLTGLTTNTTYYVRVRAIATGGALSPGTASSASVLTSNEVAPTFTFTSANLTSTSVSYSTPPFISIAYTAGTAGTYAIGTRQYSVVAGTGAAGTFTTISVSSPFSVTTTHAGAAILPGTQYTVYMKYIATSPGVTSTIISATHPTAAEILADAPTVSLASTPTTITVTRGNYTSSPTYQQKYQYAYGTTVDPTNFADFPTSGTASSVTITGLLHATTFYVRVRAIATGGALSPGAASSASIATTAEVKPTPVAPILASNSVSSPTLPYISITWAAGTAGTYAIATRQYSVVEGTGAAGTFTTVSGSTGTVSVTTTHAGVAILPGTLYKVYMKYIATSPGTESDTASATITTGTEILANAPSLSLPSPTPTTITITRGNHTNSPAPTYVQKYQYAYGTTASPTNYVDFPSSGTAATVTITGLMHATTFYVRVRAIATGGALSPGTASTTPASIATTAEVAPTFTFVNGNLDSTSVSYDSNVPVSPAPFISIAYTAGTAGTYAIGTRKYSVVAGTGTAGTFTNVPVSSPFSVTTTAAGVAILPDTEYTVYMKYTATSPGTASTTESATHTTAVEIKANQITADASITEASTSLTFNQHRTQFVIFRGNYSNSPTYPQKYQYAVSTSPTPTNFKDFPTSGTASSVTLSSFYNASDVLTSFISDTTYYVRTRAIATGGALSPGVQSVEDNVRLNAALPPTPTIAWRDMTGASYGTAKFTITGNGGSTTAVKVNRRTASGVDGTFVDSATGDQNIDGYASNGGREYYVAYNYNRHDEASTASNQISWKRPEKGQPWNSGYIQTSAIYFSTTANCTSEFSYTFGTVPSSDNVPGYIAVNKLSVDGVQQTGGSVNGCAFMEYTVANKTHLTWVSDSFHPDFTADIFGTSSTAGFSGSWPYLNGTFGTATTGTLSNWGGSNISGKYFQVRTSLGSRTAGCAVGCGSYNGTTLQTYRMKNFILSGIQTLSGTVYN